MEYYILCTCGEEVSISADDKEKALKKMVLKMDKHIKSKPHPDVPAHLSRQEKENMARSAMKVREAVAAASQK